VSIPFSTSSLPLAMLSPGSDADVADLRARLEAEKRKLSGWAASYAAAWGRLRLAFCSELQETRDGRAVVSTNEPRQVNVTLFEESLGDRDWPPEGLVEFVAWAQNMLERGPEAFRGTAKIEIENRSEYYTVLEISYQRPETDGEMARRLDDEQKRAAAREADARAQYERLKAMFEAAEIPPGLRETGEPS
jgi:hypothetical protein